MENHAWPLTAAPLGISLVYVFAFWNIRTWITSKPTSSLFRGQVILNAVIKPFPPKQPKQ